MSNIVNPSTDLKNPELLELLRDMDPRGGLAPVTPEEKRRAYREAVSRFGPPEPVASVEDGKVPRPWGEIPVRIYHPKLDQDGTLPIALYFHGGGFVSGDLDTHDPVCRALANHVPATVVAVDYRLAPESPFPAAPEDCYAVLRCLASNAASLGISSNRRLAILGDSAGGNLAAVAGLMARDRGLQPTLAAQILIYPMLDATLSCTSLVENAFVPPFTLVDCVASWQQYLGPDVDRREPYVSPLLAANLSGLPPALVLTAEYDILADEGETYANRLKEAGVSVEHEHFDGMIHGFFQWGATVAAARLAMNRVVQFLQRHLSCAS